MTDVVVTVPMNLWDTWIAERCVPGDDWNDADAGYWREISQEAGRLQGYHFWLQQPFPQIEPGERVYIVAHGLLRGYAPLVVVEQRCSLRPSVGCLLRQGGAVAVTIDQPIRGFRGWRYRDWDRTAERPFPEWRTTGVPSGSVTR